MLSNIGLFTYLAASISFAVLTSLLLLHWRVKPLGPPLIIACTATSLWAGTIGLGTLAEYPPVFLTQVTELVRNTAWLFFLMQLLGLQSSSDPWTIKNRSWLKYFWPAITVVITILLAPFLQTWLPTGLSVSHQATLTIWLTIALAGLLLIEQLYRNADHAERWSLKYLCLGLGSIFAYDFFMYSEALLFRELDPNLWWARGFINAVACPWLAIAMARNSGWRMHLHVSRQVVFHSVTLMGAGLYLLGMAAIGYFIKFMGGTWGGVLQIGFLAAAGAILFSLMFSGKARALLRVQLSKHFFSYRYDYREEWLNFTKMLASLGHNVAQGIIRTMAPLASSPAGLLWGRNEEHGLRLLAHWEMPIPKGIEEGLGNMPEWLQRTDWVIDMPEWRYSRDLYGDLQLPSWLDEQTQIWLIIPLVFRDRIEGILMLKRSDLKSSINWEDRDLLKTAGRQAASHLAQHLASEALLQARQFDAFNRLSAYLVHDLKNILAQQSLIVSNAAKHRDNPAFIDDMIATVENSVARMQRLMEQMRTGMRTNAAENVQLQPLLQSVIESRTAYKPAPTALFKTGDCTVEADSERLGTVFNHLIQNAQEATEPDGSVRVIVEQIENRVKIDIEDTGHGMDNSFIQERLFQPFESTKGLTGMGIGVFESREYIRQLGGDIQVESTPGIGSIFHVTLPALEHSVARIAKPEQGSLIN